MLSPNLERLVTACVGEETTVENRFQPSYTVIDMMTILMIGSLISSSPVKTTQPTTPAQTDQIRYVAIGDSYTLGEGVAPEESWPALLTEHLAANGINIRLIANPSKTGWTTQDAIDRGLPAYEAARPTFATFFREGICAVGEDNLPRRSPCSHTRRGRILKGDVSVTGNKHVSDAGSVFQLSLIIRTAIPGFLSTASGTAQAPKNLGDPGDGLWHLGREHKAPGSALAPLLHGLGRRNAVKRAVHLHGVEVLGVFGKKVCGFAARRIEAAYPAVGGPTRRAHEELSFHHGDQPRPGAESFGRQDSSTSGAKGVCVG